MPLEQFESATQRQAVCVELSTGAGDNAELQELPPLPAQATELGGFSQPWPSLGFDDLPVHPEPLQMQ